MFDARDTASCRWHRGSGVRLPDSAAEETGTVQAAVRACWRIAVQNLENLQNRAGEVSNLQEKQIVASSCRSFVIERDAIHVNIWVYEDSAFWVLKCKGSGMLPVSQEESHVDSSSDGERDLKSHVGRKHYKVKVARLCE